MRFARLDYSDGQFTLCDMNQPEAIYMSPQDRARRGIVEVSERVWAAWQTHVDQCAVWHDLLRRMDNDREGVRDQY